MPDLDIPPITGLVVIPGNIAFLNQFFSVLLMVTNVAPDGTTLELRETTATIVLPTGLDRVRGTFEQPGDDPLRLARIEGIGVQPTVPVLQLGPDGLRNTADDIRRLSRRRGAARGEFLVEGLKEGSHLFDLEIEAMLYGLPSGPVKLMGLSAGAVFVRNPTFSVTLAHPRTIRSGEHYDLYATVTNTSQTAANLVVGQPRSARHFGRAAHLGRVGHLRHDRAPARRRRRSSRSWRRRPARSRSARSPATPPPAAASS